MAEHLHPQEPARVLPQPRRIDFPFPDELSPQWKPDDPEFCAMVNGASLAMPYLEPFLIRTVRETGPLLTDAFVQDSARAFNRQEQHHYQTHRRFNELLKARRYPELAQLEAQMQVYYERLAGRSLRVRMAYTAGFEAMTLGVTRWLVDNRVRLFGGGDTRVASFILWHFVEESEHKCVAHDVYQSVFGSGPAAYAARLLGVLQGSLSVMLFSMRGYKAILRRDGLWTQWRSRLRLARHLASFVGAVMPYLLRALLPGHDPRREADPPWVAEWLRAYAACDAGAIPLLDTAHPQMPVLFIHMPDRGRQGESS